MIGAMQQAATRGAPEREVHHVAQGVLARAQVHATLALVAATADAANRMVWTGNVDGDSHQIQNGQAWTEAIG